MRYHIRMAETKGRVVVLLGPTAAGKTGAAVLLAQKLGTEIISADSMQVYRHMDLGTAKPSRELLKAVRHHMVGIVEPGENYSVGRFIEDAEEIIKGLHARGKVPVVVGGTGLYIKAMTRGLFSGPSADWSLRAELIEAERETPGVLYERLKRLDPDTAVALMPEDTRRVVRALEVCLSAGGAKMSEMKMDTEPLPYEFIKVGVTRERAELYRMIEQRVDAMLGAGLLEEVKKLLTMEPGRTPMQAIGYKEVAGHLRGTYSLDEAVGLIKRNTKRYAKRQFTWFKKEEGIHWVDVTGVFDGGEIFEKVWEVVRGRV